MADEENMGMATDNFTSFPDGGQIDADEAALRHIAVQEERTKSWSRIVIRFFFTFCCLGVFFIFCWHLAMPEKWRWLASSDLESIKGVTLTIAGGLAMSVGTTLFMKES